MADVNVNRITHIVIDGDEITTGIESGSMFLQRTLLDGNLSFGRFCSSRFELRLHGREIDETEKEDVSIYQVENPGEEDEEIINIFTGNIDSAKFIPQGLNAVTDVVYDIVMYDKSYFIRHKDCAAWWETFWTTNQSATLKQLRESLLSYVGLTDANVVIENEEIIIPKKPVEITRISFADMFEYITAISGTVPFIDGAGVVRYWNPSLADSHSFDGNVEKANSEFNKFSSALIIGYAEQLGGDGNPIASYEEEAEIGKISLKYNPILSDVPVETVEDILGLEDALKVIVNDYYYVDQTLSGTVKAIVCDPTVELGSLITVGDNKLFALKMNMSGSRLIEQEFISDLLSSDSSEEVTEGEFSPEFIYLSQQIQSTKEELEEQIDDIQVSEEYAQAVDEFNSAIAASTGLLSLTVRQQDGTIKKYFYAPSTDESLKPEQRKSIVNSNYIFTMTSAGFAWTNKWEGDAEATSESHKDPTTGEDVVTVWNYGIDRNGNAILRSLTVNKIQADQIAAGAITADKIRAGAITVSKSNLGQDVIDFIESQGGEDDGINVHATAGTLSGNDYPLTTTEQVTELAEGDIVAITFPNGINFAFNTSGSTYLYKPRTVSIGSNTYTLLNANGTTDWCNVKDSADYASNVTVKYIARTLDSTLKLCELVEVENVVDNAITVLSGDDPYVLTLENLISNPNIGTVLNCDISSLTYGLAFRREGQSSLASPLFAYSETYQKLLSKAHYSSSNGIADAYTLEELDVVEYDSADYSGTSDTDASTQEKYLYISDFSLAVGVTVDITFTYGNSVNYPTLYVFGSGRAADIMYFDGSEAQRMRADNELNWSAGEKRRFTWNTTYYAWIISKPVSYYSPKDKTSVNIILEKLRTSSGTTLRAFELRFDPVSTQPAVVAIDEEAREAADRALIAAMAANTAAGNAQDAVDALDSDVDSRISDAISGITVEGTITTFYGTCSTAAGTAAKVVNVYTSDGSTLDDSFTLKKGAIINVSFSYANTATTPTLNVNGTGAKAIYVNNAQLHYGSSYTTNAYNWKANTVVQFMYDGSYWRMSQTSADLILANFCADNNMTVIDGSKIYAGNVTSKKIQANSIYATDALLGNLLACSATITGLLKIYGLKEMSSGDSRILDIINNSTFEAAVKELIDYDNLPTYTKQAILLANKLAYAQIVYSAKNSVFKLYERWTESGTTYEMAVGAICNVGLVFASNGFNDYDVRKWTVYGHNGMLFKGRSMPPYEIKTVTVYGDGTSATPVTVPIYGYTNPPTVMATIQSGSDNYVDMSVRVGSITANSFKVFVGSGYNIPSTAVIDVACVIYSND